MKRRNVNLTPSELDAVFKYWIKRLALERWHITWSLFDAPPPLEELRCTQGETVADALNRTASIRILPLELWGDPETPHDMEQIAVHELLHAKVDFLWRHLSDEPTKQDELHAIVDEMAWLLVDEKRSGRSARSAIAKASPVLKAAARPAAKSAGRKASR